MTDVDAVGGNEASMFSYFKYLQKDCLLVNTSEI